MSIVVLVLKCYLRISFQTLIDQVTMQDCSKTVLHIRSSGGMLGAENVILEIAKHSREWGYQSIVGALHDIRDPDPELLAVAGENGLQIVKFTCSERIDFECAKQIKKFVASEKVNVLHCHGYKEDVYGVLSRVSVPKIATNHLWKTNSIMLRLYRIIDAFLLRRFDLVAGVSDEIVAEMKGRGIKNSVKVPNGIDVKKFHIEKKVARSALHFGLNPHSTLFGMISSLTSEKNHALVVDALARLENEDIELLIVGDGPLLSKLKKRVARLGVSDRVFFVGRQNNIREILSVVDVFLLSSIKEGLPMALLEAMACGKAVIVSRVGENAHVVDDGRNGLVVESGDVSGFTNAMQVLINRKDLITEFGRKARKTVEQKFSSKIMTRSYCHLYDQALTGSVSLSQSNRI